MACEGGAEDEDLWKCGGSLRGGGAMPEFIDISVLEEQRLAPPLLSPEGVLPPPAEDTDNRDAPTLEPPWQFPADEESLRVVAFVPFSKPSPEIPTLQPEAPPSQTDTVPDKNDKTDSQVTEKSGDLPSQGESSQDSSKPMEESSGTTLGASSTPEVDTSSNLEGNDTLSAAEDDKNPDVADAENGAPTVPEVEPSIALGNSGKDSSTSLDDSKTDIDDSVALDKHSDIEESSCAISSKAYKPEDDPCLELANNVESTSTSDNQILDPSSSSDTAKPSVDSTSEIIPPTLPSPNSPCPVAEDSGTPVLTFDDSPASPDAASQTCNDPTLLKEPAVIPTETQIETENCSKSDELAENVKSLDTVSPESPNPCFEIDISTIKEEPVTDTAIPSGDEAFIQEQTDYKNPVEPSLKLCVTDNDLLNCSFASQEDTSVAVNVSTPPAIETSCNVKTEITISELVPAKIEPESPVKDTSTSTTNISESVQEEKSSIKETNPEKQMYVAKVEVVYEDVSTTLPESISNLKSEDAASCDVTAVQEPNKETIVECSESLNQKVPVSQEAQPQESNPKVKNTGCSTEVPSLSVEEVINAEAEKFIASDPQPFVTDSMVSLGSEPPPLEKSPIASLQKAVRKIDPKKGFGSKINTIDVIAEQLGVKNSKKKDEKREKKGYMQREMPVPYPYKNHPMMMGSHPPIREFSGMMPPTLSCQMPYMQMPNYPQMMPGSPMMAGMPMYHGAPCYLPPSQKQPSKLVQVKYFSGSGGMKTKFVEVPSLPPRNLMPYEGKAPEKGPCKIKPRDDSLTPVVQKVIANRAELDVLPIRRSKQNPIIPEVVLEEGPPNGHFNSNPMISQPPVSVSGRYLDIAEAPVRCDSLTIEKARPSSKPSSEEIVFNSTDLKVILVQPESELHSSKKSQLSEDGDSRQRAKIRSKKRGSLESVCEKLTKLKGEQAPELELSVVKVQEPVELVPEPSEAPEIVLLQKETNGDVSDPHVSILKVPRPGEAVQKTVTNGRMKQLNRNIINVASPSTPKSSPSKRGRKSGVSVVRVNKSLTPTASTTPPTQQGPPSPLVPNKEVIVSSRLSNCGGKVVVGIENQVVAKLPPGLSIVAKEPAREKEVPETLKKPESSDPERLAAIDRLKRLGTEVCLEVERPPSGGSSGGRVDTVLVAPGTSESEPRALELLETMAVNRALPVSPVLTALGHSVVPPEVQNVTEAMVPITKVTLKQQMALEQKQADLSASKKNDKSLTNSAFEFKPEKFVQDDGSFKCDICQEIYTNEEALKKHYFQLHVALDAPRDGSIKSKTKDKSNVGKGGMLRCHFCKLRFATKDAVREHLVSKHGVSDKSPNYRSGPPYQFTCPKCCQMFRWRKMYSRHRRICSKTSLRKESSIKSAAIKTSPETVKSNGDPPVIEPSMVLTPSQEGVQTSKTVEGSVSKANTSPVEVKLELSAKPDKSKELPNDVKESDTSPKTDAVALATAVSDSSTLLKESEIKTEVTSSSENPGVAESSGTESASNISNLSASGCEEPEIPDEPVKSPPEDNGPPIHHCLYCNETFRSAYRKKNHILSQHPYTRRKHSCVLCQKVLSNNPAIFNHMLTEHSDQYFGCKTCKERFATPAEVQMHRSKLHSDEVEPPQSKPVAEDASSTQEQKDYFFQCDRCERTFLIQTCLAAHNCSGTVDRSKDRLPKKPPRPVELRPRVERLSLDASGDFFSRVAANVRDNLANYLDGKLGSTGSGSDSSDNGHRTILHFSAAVGKSGTTPAENVTASVPESIPSAAVQPARPPAWEKFTFPKEYDGRCGLTSYIKDTSYLDLSTQLIMRRNLQRLNLLKDDPPDPRDDVPGVLALERLAAQTAESYGVAETTPPDSAANPVSPSEAGILTGEWVRDHTYVCSVCRWESTCLWTIEDHKYAAHPNICAPHHEIQGPDHRSIIDTVYKRLLSDPPSGNSAPIIITPPSRRVKFECSKCKRNDIRTSKDLHRHVVECAGEDVAALEAAFIAAAGSSSNKSRRRPRWRRGGRRSRQGLKRTVPSTPPASRRQNPSLKKPIRSKPGDSETIEKMIANLPAKRATRRVLGFDEIDLKTRSQSTIQNVGSMSMPSLLKKSSLKTPGKIQTSPSLRSPGIDTSAERGDVLSSLRMMPVRKRLAEEDAPPTLEIPPPPSEIVAEIPILLPEPVPEPVAPPVSSKSKKRGRPFGSKNKAPSTKVIVKTAGGLIKDKVSGKIIKKMKKKITVTVPVSTKEQTIKAMFKKVSEVSIEKKTENKVEATDKSTDVADDKTESPETKVVAPAKKITPTIALKTAKTLVDSKKKRKRKKLSFTHVKRHVIKTDEEKEVSEDSATISACETPSPPSKKMRKSDRIELDDTKRRQEAREMFEEAKRQVEETRRLEEEKRIKAEEDRKKKEEEKQKKEEEKHKKEEREKQRKEEEKQRKEEEKQRKVEEKQKAEEEKRRKMEEKKKADEEKKQRILEEKKRKEEEKRKKEEEREKKKKMDEERKKKIEEEKIKKMEEEKKRKALEEEKKKKADEEKKRRQEEEREKKRKAEEEKKKKAEEVKKRKAEEAERQKKLEEEIKKEEEEEKMRLDQEEAERKKKEEERKQRLKEAAEERKRKKEEEERKKLEEEARKKKDDEEKKAKAEEEKERKKKQDEERKRKLEEERERRKRKAAEEEKRKQEEEERRLKEEELIKRLEEEKLALEEENRRIEEGVRKRSEGESKDNTPTTPRQRRRREVSPIEADRESTGDNISSGVRLRRRREVSPIESLGSGRESSNFGDGETTSSTRLRRRTEVSPMGMGDERVSSTIEDDDMPSNRIRVRREFTPSDSIGDVQESSFGDDDLTSLRARRRSDLSLEGIYERRESSSLGDTSSVGEDSEEASSEDSFGAAKRGRMRKKKVSLVKRLMKKKNKVKLSPSSTSKGREVVKMGGGMTWEVEPLMIAGGSSEEPSLVNPTPPPPTSNWSSPVQLPQPSFQPSLGQPAVTPQPQTQVHQPVQQNPVWRDQTPSLGTILDSVNTCLEAIFI